RCGAVNMSATMASITVSRTLASILAPSSHRRFMCRDSGQNPPSWRGVSGMATYRPSPIGSCCSVFRDSGGEGKPAQAGYKVCWSSDEKVAVATAHRLWATSGLPGELSQVLPSPRHFEQVSALVTEPMTAEAVACGPDVDRH